MITILLQVLITIMIRRYDYLLIASVVAAGKGWVGSVQDGIVSAMLS